LSKLSRKSDVSQSIRYALELWPALLRYCGDGLIEIDREEIVEGRLRRYYRLTRSGAQVLADEADRMRANASVATRRLKGLATGLAGGAP